MKLILMLTAASALVLAGCAGTSEPSSSSNATSTVSQVASSLPAISSAPSSRAASSSVRPSSAPVVSSSSIVRSSSSSSAPAVSSAASSSATLPSACRFDDVKKVFTDNNCMLCHNAQSFGGIGGGLNLDTGNVGANLLDRTTGFGGVPCADEKVIDSNDMGNSLLLKLIDPNRYPDFNAGSCKRNPMPQTGARLKPAEVKCVEQWIEHVIDTENPTVEPEAPAEPFAVADSASALIKAKYLLNGSAVTKQELNAVVSGSNFDPVALRERITQWQKTPNYEAKMKSFLKQALQMEEIPGSFGYRYQLGNFGGVRSKIDNHRALWEGLNNMFVDMAWDIVKNDQRFNRIATTRRWKVTTAILVALGYAEKENQTPGRVYSELPAKEDRLQLFEHLKPSDFNDWRYVNITQSDNPIRYANTAGYAATMRNYKHNDEVAMRFPRVGFFSAPAFLELWVTNDGNQFRVTASQSLITALDATFSASDPTAHRGEAGIDLDHADPSTVCYQCHRLMDPMKLVFSNFQTTNHRSKDVDDSVKPSFAFMGVRSAMKTPDDFGRLLAEHPRFPVAWVQKLCMWGNSQRCSEADPEFQRLAESFKNNNLNFNQLVRDFFSSPIFTATEKMETHEKNEYLVSLSRSNHLCHAIDTRLADIKATNNTKGSVQICNKNSGKLGIIGKDGLNRGDAEFVQVKSVSTFDAQSIDSQCAAARSKIFANSDNRIIDSRKSIDEITGQITRQFMGLPENHSRYNKTVNELKRVYNIASNGTNCPGGTNAFDQNAVSCGFGESKVKALEYVWFAACTSPELISLGF